jgi:hypothetical protein
MQKIVLLCLAGFAVVGSVYCGYLSTIPVETGLVMLAPRRNFGTVQQGQTVATSFTLVNKGPEGVRVVSVSKKCDCTDAKLEKYFINPGESTTLSVTWEIGAKRGKASSNVEVIYIISTGGVPQELMTELTADVLPDLNFSPEELHFGSGLTNKQSIIYSPASFAKLEVLSAQCSHRAFQVVLNRIESRLEITFDPEIWPQDVDSAQVVVKTNSPNEPICHIPLWVDKQTEHAN